MKSLGERLVNKLKSVSEAETALIQLSSAIYIKTVEEKIENGLNSIKSNFISSAKGYGIKEEVYSGNAKLFIEEFNTEIEKIKNEYEIQYVNLQLELQEIMANQQISIVNAKKMVDLKKEFIQSEKYKEFLKAKKNLEDNMANALKKEEYDKYSKLLENLSDPLDLYNLKRETAISKYYEYNSLIRNCEVKMENSLENVLKEIDIVIDTVVSKALIEKPESIISSIINKIKNIFSGKANYDRKVKSYENAISLVKDSSSSKLDVIRNNTTEFLAEFKVMKDELNKKSA